MKPNFPMIELCDRYAIAKVKQRRTGANGLEFDFYQDEMEHYDLSTVSHLLDQLEKIHDTIWDLEKELKTGKEDLLSLEEIGRRAIKIRDWNNQRIRIKNEIATLLGDPVREIKIDHLSQ